MNSGLDNSLYPAQVFAQFTTNDRGAASPPKDERKLTNFAKNDNQQQSTTQSTGSGTTTLDIIHIFESGEVTLLPDQAKVVIVCSNTKDSAEEVKASVTKRVEYILQTLRSHNIGKNCYTIDRCLKRKELKYYFRVEITVQFTDLKKCQDVSNFLVEKLDTSVDIFSPTFHYAPGKLESLRRQACILAVHNAKVKALEIASSLNQTLGRARQIFEESTEEFTGSTTDLADTEPKTYQQLLKIAAVTVVTKISVSFELKGKIKRKK